ncbi:hypothetical protein CHS0354_001250, partial [Potamilus streckersoni]
MKLRFGHSKLCLRVHYAQGSHVILPRRRYWHADLANLYTIFQFDVCKHSERLKDSHADIKFHWTVTAGVVDDYVCYALVTSDQFMTLDVFNGKMNIL